MRAVLCIGTRNYQGSKEGASWNQITLRLHASSEAGADRQGRNASIAQIKIVSRHQLVSAPRWRCVSTGSSRRQGNAAA